MAKSNFLVYLCIFMLCCHTMAHAQQTKQENSVLSEQQPRVEGLISFLQYILNTVGDGGTPVKEKETIITESYLKLFKNGEVQIEDDLLENREVLINKPVSSYLRDVEFFFRNVQFEFQILSVEIENHENGGKYFKVTLNRTLKGVTIDDEEISNTQKRFVEINWDQANDDLKIASIYTTKISRDEELRTWWNSLSFEWMSIFSHLFSVEQEIASATLYKIIALDSLDLSGNPYLIDLQPLEMLNKLKYLDISHTQIVNLAPLRGLNELRELRAGFTKIESLEPLRYCSSLEKLTLNNTTLRYFDGWYGFKKLSYLDLSSTPLLDYDFLELMPSLTHLILRDSESFKNTFLLKNLGKLLHLDLSATGITDLNGLPPQAPLQQLLVSRTKVMDFFPLQKFTSLTTVAIQHCPVATLEDFKGIPKLKKIDADNSGISQETARKFMEDRPQVLVIVNAKENELWWQQLSPDWKALLRPKLQLRAEEKPSVELLVQLFNIDSLSLAGANIIDATPLEKFQQLISLDISNTKISSLAFAPHLTKLQQIDFSKTQIQEVKPLQENLQLKKIYANQSAINNLLPLARLPQLVLVEAEGAPISKENVASFLAAQPETLIIFQAAKLQQWWQQLDVFWQQELLKNVSSKYPDKETLHRLVTLQEVKISGVNISQITPLNEFIRLQEVSFSGTSLRSLEGIQSHTFLKSLTCSQSPLSTTEDITQLKNLNKLDISNTPIDDLKFLAQLPGLQQLNISGTNIKSLKGLEGLRSLQKLDCSNTNTRNLNPVSDLQNIRELVCFNTKISQKQVDSFLEGRSSVKVIFY